MIIIRTDENMGPFSAVPLGHEYANINMYFTRSSVQCGLDGMGDETSEWYYRKICGSVI